MRKLTNMQLNVNLIKSGGVNMNELMKAIDADIMRLIEESRENRRRLEIFMQDAARKEELAMREFKEFVCNIVI